MKKLVKLIPVGMLLPFLTLAVSGTSVLNSVGVGDNSQSNVFSNVDNILGNLGNWVGYLVGFLMAVAILVFFWGIIKYVISGGDEEARKSARGFMIYGIIGLFVMVSVWGLVALLGSIFGVEQGGAIDTPTIPGGDTDLIGGSAT